jgi:Peptidase family M48
MSFKIKIAGLEGSDILHMRPIKAWSHWDTAVAVAHFGTASALTLAVGVNLMFSGMGHTSLAMQIWGGLGDSVGMFLSLITGKESYSLYKSQIETSRKTDLALEALPEITLQKLDDIKKSIHPQLTHMGDKRTLRFIDLDNMYKTLGASSASTSPSAAVAVSQSENFIYIGVNHALLSSRDEERLFGIVAHEVAHQVGPATKLNNFSYSLTIGSSVISASTIAHSILFLHPSSIPLATLALVTVPLIRSAYQKRQEFRADRGGAAFIGSAQAMRNSLNQLGGDDLDDLDFGSIQASGRLTYGTFGVNRFSAILQPICYLYLNKLNSTHPKISRRLRALEILGKQQLHRGTTPS